MHKENGFSFAGQFLKSYREKQNLTQEQFASDLGIEPRTLRAYENGERQLTMVDLFKIKSDKKSSEDQCGCVLSLIDAHGQRDGPLPTSL